MVELSMMPGFIAVLLFAIFVDFVPGQKRIFGSAKQLGLPRGFTISAAKVPKRIMY
jgi:hypothetical protein